MLAILTERFLRKALIMIALGGLVLVCSHGGLVAMKWQMGAWAAGTAPVVVGLLISMIRDFLAGRMGVDAIAFVSMSAALVLGEIWQGSLSP